MKHYTANLKREEVQDCRNRMRSVVAEVSRHLRRQSEPSTRLPEGASTREELVNRSFSSGKTYGRPQRSLRPKPSWIYKRPCSIPCCSICEGVGGRFVPRGGQSTRSLIDYGHKSMELKTERMYLPQWDAIPVAGEIQDRQERVGLAMTGQELLPTARNIPDSSERKADRNRRGN